MKKEALLILITIFFIEIISASYGCSNGSIISDKNVIDLGDIESINKVDIALIDVSGIGAADIIVDVDEIKLTNSSSSVEVELLSGKYGIELTNLTDNSAWIKVENNNKEVESNIITEIGNLKVYATSMSGTYPGEDANVELIVGTDYFFLYRVNPSETKKIANVDYLFELSSATDTAAMINVEKCENGDIIEISDTIKEDLNNLNDTGLNDTIIQNDTIQNQSQNDSSITSINEFDNDTASSEDLDAINKEGDKEGKQSNILSFLKKYSIYIIIFVVVIIALFIVIFFYNKNKKIKTQVAEITKSREGSSAETDEETSED